MQMDQKKVTPGLLSRERSYIDTEPPVKTQSPTGPYELKFPESAGDLLLFVPRNEIGRTIDRLTGRYGYSHLAIDGGEVDVPTGRRVMIEATVAPGVHYAFQDEYGDRPYVRISLHAIGMDVGKFCDCIRAKVGEKFDNLEIFTLGIFDNPARQICSDVATVCLPDDIRERIVRSHRSVNLHPLSAVREEKPGHHIHLFVSPNGFAEFLGAPKGNEIRRPNETVQTHIQEKNRDEFLSRLWKLGDALVTRVSKFIDER